MGLAKRIIPCLDVAHGRVVKGVNFVNLRDAGDPVEVARRYDEQGADELAFLDIRASIETRALLYDMIEAVADQVFIPLTVGGGVSRVDDIRALLNAGADKVSINPAGVRNPALFDEAASRYGAQCVVAAIDARPSASGGWDAYTDGGRNPAGRDAGDFARGEAGPNGGLARRSELERRWFGARHRAGGSHGGGAHAGVDESRSARTYRGHTRGILLVPFAAQALAQGRDVRSRAARARNPARLRQ